MWSCNEGGVMQCRSVWCSIVLCSVALAVFVVVAAVAFVVCVV